MSTKIHNGYRLRSDSLSAVGATLAKLRESVRLLAGGSMAQRIAADAVRVIDLHALGRPIPADLRYEGDSPLVWAMTRAMDRYRAVRRTSVRDPEYDPECEVGVWPHADMAYLNVCTERGEYLPVLASLPGVEPYPYWDNNDRPPEVTAAQWARRGAAWRRATRKPCLVFQCLGPYGLPTFEVADLIDASVAPAEERAASYARWDVIDERVGPVRDADTVARTIEAAEWTGTPEGAAKVALRAAELALRLPSVGRLIDCRVPAG